MPTATIAERVARGAAVLDERNPFWRSAMPPEPDALEMGDCSACVLGWLYGYYWDGLDALHVADRTTEQIEWAKEHGFSSYGQGKAGCEEDEKLADAWRELYLSPKG